MKCSTCAVAAALFAVALARGGRNSTNTQDGPAKNKDVTDSKGAGKAAQTTQVTQLQPLPGQVGSDPNAAFDPSTLTPLGQNKANPNQAIDTSTLIQLTQPETTSFDISQFLLTATGGTGTVAASVETTSGTAMATKDPAATITTAPLAMSTSVPASHGFTPIAGVTSASAVGAVGTGAVGTGAGNKSATLVSLSSSAGVAASGTSLTFSNLTLPTASIASIASTASLKTASTALLGTGVDTAVGPSVTQARGGEGDTNAQLASLVPLPGQQGGSTIISELPGLTPLSSGSAETSVGSLQPLPGQVATETGSLVALPGATTFSTAIGSGTGASNLVGATTAAGGAAVASGTAATAVGSSAAAGLVVAKAGLAGVAAVMAYLALF